jgi:Tfp pilus assembly protein FimT
MIKRRNNRGYTLAELMIVLGAIVLGGTILFVISHFIAKFW